LQVSIYYKTHCCNMNSTIVLAFLDSWTDIIVLAVFQDLGNYWFLKILNLYSLVHCLCFYFFINSTKLLRLRKIQGSFVLVLNDTISGRWNWSHHINRFLNQISSLKKNHVEFLSLEQHKTNHEIWLRFLSRVKILYLNNKKYWRFLNY